MQTVKEAEYSYNYGAHGWGLATKETCLPVHSEKDIRELILNVESQIKSLDGSFVGDNDACPLKHSFADGVYVREIFIPAGMLLVGKIHRHDHPNFLMSGEVSVLTEFGGVERLSGPLSMISKAGTKRIVFAHTDTVWTTIHVTQETDIEKIEAEIISPDYEFLEENIIEVIT